ncbi:FtsX-like permease family protein [uncultured Cellulomonas sp.]|uniref:ABC transporter permease n=1 Tax=uncultured Cellulomonas sp. TaxID=189682 RepID=UPI0026263D90|nr:FtsX-like permease family protein [uncultured Cellulomonas sp.]
MFVAWRDLRFARGRFTLMGVVIILITMLVVMLSGLTAGLGRENTSAVLDLPADHLAFAAPLEDGDVSFSDSTLEAEAWEQWAQVPGVEAAEPLAIVTTRVEHEERTAAVSVFGVRPASPLLPETDAGTALEAGTVVLSAGAAEALDAEAGDTVTAAGHDLVVGAIAGEGSYSHTPVVWADLTDTQPLLRADDPSTQVATVVALIAPDIDGTDLAAADEQFGTKTLPLGATASAIGSFSEENGSLQLMRGFLFAISALVIGAFFMVWTIQRSGDVAVLKALGASTRYLLRDALGQAVVLLVLGTALGTAIAAGLGALVQGSVPFVLDPATVLLPAAVMVVLGAAGAALSIRQITSVDPLTALGSAR